jgi:hypothetical protein
MFFDSTRTIQTLGMVSILMVSGAVRAQNIVSKGQPAAVTILDSTKEQDGLKGSVRRVRTESAKLELQGGSLVEGPRRLLEITTYSPRGDRVENVSYPSSDLVGKEEYKYDDKGNIIEMTLRDESVYELAAFADRREVRLLAAACHLHRVVDRQQDPVDHRVFHAKLLGGRDLLHRLI